MYCYNCMNELKEGTDYCYHCAKKSTPDNIPHHLAPGTILENKYLVGNALGEGGFGITYIGYDLNLDLKIAIKEFYPSGYANRNNTVSNKVTLNYQNNGEYFKKGRDSFLREAKSIAKFSKESGIVDVRDFFTENDTAYIIMEFIDGVTLSKQTSEKGLFDSCEIFKLMIPIMKSLEKMHKEGIIHRDISPDNIMYTEDGTLKLMDFGSARYFSGAEQKTMSVVLKPGYAPYEQYSSKGNQGPWTDVYGLCATLYKCITGKAPVDSLDRCQNDTLKKPSELGINITPSLENVLMYGLAVYHDNRCQSMEELIEITEKSLNNEQFHLKNAGNTSAVDDIYRTKEADEKYKTMFADKTYGDGNLYDNADKDAFNNTSPHNITDNAPAPKKKSRALLVSGIAVAVIAALAIVGFVLFNSLNSGEKNSSENETTVAEETTQEETEPPTTAVPTTESNIVIMSDESGKKLSDAESELKKLGLKVETKFEETDSVAEDYVIRQSVEPGRQLNKGDTVMLYVAKVPKETKPPTEQSDDDVYLYCCASDYVTLRDRPSRTGLEKAKISTRESVKYISSTGDFYFVSYGDKIGYVLKEFFSENKNAPLNYGNGNALLQTSDTLYCCASNYATLREAPSRDSDEICKIYTRDEVSYISATGDFYFVSYGNSTGYVLKSYFATSTDAPLNYGAD